MKYFAMALPMLLSLQSAFASSAMMPPPDNGGGPIGVPEPTTMALMAIGVGAVVVARRIKK